MRQFGNVEHSASQSIKGAVFSPDHPPPRRREMYRRSIHMLNCTYEDDIKIKKKHVAGISRTFYLSTETISRLPQSRETIPLTISLIYNAAFSTYLRLWKTRG
jgi:hypothetical protein